MDIYIYNIEILWIGKLVDIHREIQVVSINGVLYPNSWMVYSGKSIYIYIYKWMMWGYPYFRKPPDRKVNW